MNDVLQQTLEAIAPVDMELVEKGQAHLDDLTKPKGSLGRLEEIALRLFLIADGDKPEPYPARIYTVAGDHGVAREGVSTFPQEVTRQMVMNIAAGGAGINVLARTAGIDVKVVDAGSCGGEYPEHPELIQRKIKQGTENLAQVPAMSIEECEQALLLGIELAEMASAEGYKAVGTGEMGIANTTPSTALYCAFLGLDPVEVTGPGTGLDSEAVTKKTELIRQALKTHAGIIEAGDPIAILAALGGLEIATLTGLILGAARCQMAVAVDGFISTAAFVVARAIHPAVVDYAFISHASAEPGHAKAVEAIGDKPLLHLDMRLGEGTGAAMALFIMKSAANIFNEMATFSGAGVTEGSE